MRGRADKKNGSSGHGSPGPGEYNYDNFNTRGYYPLSTTKNANGSSFAASKTNRFKYTGN